MQTKIILAKLTAPWAVGSGDWLGCWLKIIWLVLFVAWLVVLILWMRALAAYGKNYREYEQTYGKPYQSPSERNKLTRLTLHNLRRLYLLLDSLNKLLRLLVGKLRCKVNNAGVRLENKWRNHQRARLIQVTLDIIVKCRNALSNLIWCHKSNARKQPNEKS